MAAKNATAVPASGVRAWFAEDPTRTEGLSDQALHTLRPGARGRLHPEPVQVFEKAHKGRKVYTAGTPSKTVEFRIPTGKGNGRTVVRLTNSEARARAAAAGVTVGARGVLPSAAHEAVVASLVAERQASTVPTVTVEA